DENLVLDMKQVAAAFHMTMTDVVNEALDAYIQEMKKDAYYRLTAYVKAASAAETKEILSEIENLSDEDLEIATVKRVDL
ncbi:MAG: hypothetical protein IJU59_07600, partial [Firmicutes bacterium]|nr:hypothetical protein [Bacillota bacterium]